MMSRLCSVWGFHTVCRWTGATGGAFRIKLHPAKPFGCAVARSTPPFGTRPMNSRQVHFLLAGICLCALSWLFPAWLYEDEKGSAVSSAGYHFRYSRPPLKMPDQMVAISALEPTGNTMRLMSIHVDGVRELGQTVAVVLFTLGSILISVQRRFVGIHLFGWVCVFAGVCVLALLTFYMFFLLS
jgi:hypothetical protein